MAHPSKELCKSEVSRAFMESLEDFGESGKAAIVPNLQRRGLFLEDKHVSLSMLYDVLIELFGEQATEIVMENVIIALDKFHDNMRPRDSTTDPDVRQSF